MSGLLGHRGVLMGGAPSILWTPANLLIAPKIWLDWNSAVTDVSGAASDWSNSQGSIGGSFTQSTAGSCPTILSAEISGKRALRFDNDYMLSFSAGMSAIAQNVSSVWAFYAYKKRGPGVGNNSIFATVTGTGSGAGRFNSTIGSASTARPTMNIRRLDADSSAQLISSAGDTGAWLLRFDEMEYSSGRAAIFVNGDLGASNPALTSSGFTTNSVALPGPPTIGAYASPPGSNFADIDVAALFVGSGSLPSSADRQRLEGWAAWQLGLEGNLPDGHPYKSSPPYV